MKIPIDNEQAKEKYDDRCCGQSCLAIIENTSIEEVMQDWIKIFGDFQGYSPCKRVREYLKSKCYTTKLINEEKFLATPINNKFYLARVQWIGEGKKQDKPYYGWCSWFEASNHTHYILIHKEKVFCNGTGIFELIKIMDYLGDIRTGAKGKITSLLEIEKLSL